MNRKRIKKALIGAVMIFGLCLGGAVLPEEQTIRAASGQIYSCTIHPCYSHPVTEEIEDSGGQASSATGQGMVAGMIGTTGMLEVTEEGKYYLTFRMSLMDYTSNQSFKVQSWGGSGWKEASMGVTNTGTDSNGTTADVCIEVPAKKCVVRGSAYVEPMERNVIFYLYPDSFQTGKPSGMKATMVTEISTSASSVGSSTKNSSSAGSSTEDNRSKASSSESGSTTATNPSSDSTEKKDTSDSAAATAPSAASSVEENTAMEDEAVDPAQELESIEGLSLSTGGAETAEKAVADNEQMVAQNISGFMGTWQWTLVFTISLTVSGLILLGTAAWIVYYFRRNWWRWGYEDDDDE